MTYRLRDSAGWYWVTCVGGGYDQWTRDKDKAATFDTEAEAIQAREKQRLGLHVEPVTVVNDD